MWLPSSILFNSDQLNAWTLLRVKTPVYLLRLIFGNLSWEPIINNGKLQVLLFTSKIILSVDVGNPDSEYSLSSSSV